jgi:hypothetical protein
MCRYILNFWKSQKVREYVGVCVSSLHKNTLPSDKIKYTLLTVFEHLTTRVKETIIEAKTNRENEAAWCI